METPTTANKAVPTQGEYSVSLPLSMGSQDVQSIKSDEHTFKDNIQRVSHCTPRN